MIEDIKRDTSQRMNKTLDSLSGELAKIRAGRAHPSLLDQITVEYYGNPTPLNQVANVNAADSRTLTVVPWDKEMVAPIEKAIMESDLGLNPATSGLNIRIPLPPLTEERRRDLVKIIKQEGENAKIALRNIRRDAIHDVKELLKEKEISEDEAHKAEDEIQVTINQFTAKVDQAINDKEASLMEM